METTSRNSLLLVEYFQIWSQENPVFFDCSRTNQITISSLNDFAIYLFLNEQLSELSEISIAAEAADYHLGPQLMACDKFRLALALWVRVLLLWFVWLFLIVLLLSLLGLGGLFRVDGDLLGSLIIIIVVLFFLFVLRGIQSFVKGDDVTLNRVASLLSPFIKFLNDLN